MRILILGAGGFMGKALCKKLSPKHDIIGFDRIIPSDYGANKNIEFIVGNFVDTGFNELINNIDIVIHLISTTIPNENTSIIESEILENVVPSIRLLEAIKNSKVKRLIFASSGGTVYGERDKANEAGDELKPICSYGMQKKIIEDYIQFYGRVYGLDYQIMRISNPYGFGQDPNKPQGVIPIFINKILNSESIIIMGKGEQIRDYIYMDDLMDAFEKVIEIKSNQNILNIGSGVGYSLDEVINTIEKTLGKGSTSRESRKMRQCDVVKSVLNIDETKNSLRWQPRIGLNEGISQILKRSYKKVF